MLRFGVHHSLGLRLLHLVCAIFGFWIPPRKISKCRDLIIRVFGAFLTLTFITQSLFSLYMTLCFTVDSYITGVIYAVNIITVLKHLFLVIYFELKRGRLTVIYSEMQLILDKYNYPFVDLRSTCRKISQRSVLAYLVLPAVFIVLMRTNSISSVASGRGLQAPGPNETLSTVRRDFNRFFHMHSENLFRAAMVVSTCSNLRVIATHGLLLASYLVVAEQLQVLVRCLANILYPREFFIKVEPGSKGGGQVTGVSLEVWQQYQQHLSRLLFEINKFASPVTVISICCYVALLTLSAFAVTKTLSDLIYATNFMTGCLLYLIEIYLYCEVGHRIKRQADALAEVIHQGPWLGLDAALVPTLHFLTVDCQRCFSARGGPFFVLSLEFFATVVGAVFTYFIVAVQMK